MHAYPGLGSMSHGRSVGRTVLKILLTTPKVWSSATKPPHLMTRHHIRHDPLGAATHHDSTSQTKTIRR
jgi:hypothetical protein